MVELQYFGHSFFTVKDSKGTVIIDPIFHSTKTDLKRNLPIKTKLSHMKDVTAILISNETAEHFDKTAVEDLAMKHCANVVAHDVVLQKLNIPRNQKNSISSNVEIVVRGRKIKSMIAHYPKSFYPIGFMLDCDNAKIYHAGVTSLLDTFSAIRPDVALLPISSRTMDVVDAVRATKMMKPRIVVPMQYDIFEQNKKNDPVDFKKRIEESVLKTQAVILAPGQKMKI
ncbi:MAG: MBL fold metallo-hydrolase [archaeon]